jgi:hypothetical protein
MRLSMSFFLTVMVQATQLLLLYRTSQLALSIILFFIIIPNYNTFLGNVITEYSFYLVC